MCTQRVRKMFAEMVRVAGPGATIALALPTSSSFGEFFSIYWEALHNTGLTDHEVAVEHLITELQTISEVEQMAEDEGLRDVTYGVGIARKGGLTAEQVLNTRGLQDLQDWLAQRRRERLHS